jgi:hypothetical protein
MPRPFRGSEKNVPLRETLRHGSGDGQEVAIRREFA